MNNCLIFRHLGVWLLGPPRCPACPASAGAGLLCAGCLARLREACPATRCPRCALGLPAVHGAPAPACGRCLASPPAFARTLAAGPYAGPLRDLVHALKFGRRLFAARALGRLLAQRVRAAGGPLPERLVPVALHPGRQRRRGFNPSLVIARVAARELGGLPVDTRCVVRRRATPPQATLALRARAANLRGAFAVARPLPAGCHVAAVDDVMTSGHTLRAFAATLRRAGAGRVDAWVAARA